MSSPPETRAGRISGRSEDELQETLDRLEGRFFIERVRHEFPRRGEEAGYCFRTRSPQA